MSIGQKKSKSRMDLVAHCQIAASDWKRNQTCNLKPYWKEVIL
ncbi:hypothetical protein T4C_10738 [Trichinella pseudospiralis]|uniref:Uncharacterized protein n=1 Tax=Trichinella pseudospiralis TaxID=6337 RepID=A0A0V1GBN8_TRIPS|nr:hypothetical protein T4C_10738 [Trichinella pseudospiralis]